MNHAKSSLFLTNEKIEEKYFYLFNYFILCYFVPILLSHKIKGILIKIKDYFVLDSYLLTWWIGTYSRSESWVVLLDRFY